MLLANSYYSEEIKKLKEKFTNSTISSSDFIITAELGEGICMPQYILIMFLY